MKSHIEHRVRTIATQIIMEPDRHTRPVVARTSVPTEVRKWAHGYENPRMMIQNLYNDVFTSVIFDILYMEDSDSASIWETDAPSTAVVTLTRIPKEDEQ